MAWTDPIDCFAAIDRNRAPHPRVAIAAMLLTALALQACSVAGPKRSPLPQDGPNLVEVYREHISTEGAGAPARPATPVPGAAPAQRGTSGAAADRTYQAADGFYPTRAAAQVDSLDQRFRRLPNPDLVLYVYPHLARGRYPVPGYYTVFPLYESVEYAMPGEVPSEIGRIPAQPATLMPAPAAGPEPKRATNSKAVAGAAPVARAGVGADSALAQSQP